MLSILRFLRHLFIPHESNNHRPKVLHHQSLFLLILFFILSGLLLTPFKNSHQGVLGISADIPVQELLADTNQERAANGLPPLVLNQDLSNAAAAKAQNMLTENYWAHFAPDGTSPWSFIKNSGYDYIYAGENLARGYTSASDVVKAWMASPGHKANILSDNYHDIGFAVETGNLTGEDTVLVVQMFGSENSTTEVADVGKSATTQSESSIPAITLTISPVPTNAAFEVTQSVISKVNPGVAAAVSRPLINSTSFSKNLAGIVIVILLIALLIDLVIIQKKKIFRLVSHNIDHIIFLVVILLIVLFIIGKGLIL